MVGYIDKADRFHGSGPGRDCYWKLNRVIQSENRNRTRKPIPCDGLTDRSGVTSCRLNGMWDARLNGMWVEMWDWMRDELGWGAGLVWILTISSRISFKEVYTVWSKRISCYRVSEFYKEKLKFSFKIDLWTLDCILHEYIMRIKTFIEDFMIVSYSNESLSSLLLSWFSEIWQELLSNTLKHLRCDEDQRSTTDDITDLFCFYKRILVNPFAELIFHGITHISYEEWNKLCLNYSDDVEWLFELTKVYKSKGDESLYKCFTWRIDSIVFGQYSTIFYTIKSDKRWFLEAICRIEGWTQFGENCNVVWKSLELSVGWLLPWICYEIVRFLTSKKEIDWADAISICTFGLKSSQKNTILPMLLSNLYAEHGLYEDALRTEFNFINKHSQINVIDMESSLFEFYARALPSDIDCLSNICTLLQS